jgi:diguanylate cyclase (GGDEF)-like protein/hemerythrin-like metal-binding protein
VSKASILSNHIGEFEIFPWNANFDTGIAIIDEQHKKLIDLLNKLAVSLVHGDDIEYKQIFGDLASYASYHFETEETIWEAFFNNDSWLQEHRESHNSFMPQVLEIQKNQADMPVKKGLRNVLNFLIRWLTYHIIESDKHMVIAVREMEAGASLEQAKKISQQQMLNSEKILIDTISLMYDELSSRSMIVEQERVKRLRVVRKLKEANHELRKMATTDQLTGLHNRRHFQDIFQKELSRATRMKHYITFMMIDIDYFKRLNDIYGHLYGDDALNQAGQKLTELCRRPGDFVFRLGGEEFGILITDQELIQKSDFSEKIRAEIEDLQIANSGSEISGYMTVSIGIISKIPDLSDRMEDYIKVADARLYSAKQAGRNCIVAKD